MSAFPELRKTTPKGAIVNIIILSDFLETKVPTDGLGAQPIDYAQIEFIADCILARNASHSQDRATKEVKEKEKEKEVIPNANLGGKKNSAAKNGDPVSVQEEKVRSLYQTLSRELNPRFPPDPNADPLMSAEEEDAIFRENATHLHVTISLSLSMFQEDAKLHADLLMFDDEEETLRLMKKAAEAAKPKQETQAEVIRRNMDFIASDPPIPTLPFEEDYVEQYSNPEDMAKMQGMLKVDGPLGRAYQAKVMKQEAQKNISAGYDGGVAGVDIHGGHENDYFHGFGK